MSASFNSCTFVGNIVRDPEIKYTQSGKAYTRFTIAVNRNTGKNDADAKPKTDFVRIVTWDNLAETCNKYLKKGMSVLINGRLAVDQYEKEGQKRESYEIVGITMQMLGGKGSASDENGAASAHEAPGAPADDSLESEIPF